MAEAEELEAKGHSLIRLSELAKRRRRLMPCVVLWARPARVLFVPERLEGQRQ